MGRLDGKVTIITGAGGSIMGDAAILFAKEGAKVIVADVAESNGEIIVKKIMQTGGCAIFVETDVSKAVSIDEMINFVINKYGSIDILINGAAIDLPQQVSTADCPEDVFDRTYSVNLKGTWLCMKYAYPELVRSGGGSIINITSIAAHLAFPGIPAYSASKGGVISLSQVAAIEFASSNIRVNCVSPGPIRTPMIIKQWGEAGLSNMAKYIPRGRLGTTKDIANAVLFLASDAAENITGHTLVVDGGMKISAMKHDDK